MSTAPNPVSTPIVVTSKAALPDDRPLRSGNLLSIAECDALARSASTTLVTLVGPPDAGKSTLLATMHEGFRGGKFDSHSFAGSRTLVAFEQVCHLARLASGLEQPDTQRSKFSEEELFYHLAIRHDAEQDSMCALLVIDVAGEGFDDLRKSHENCRTITSLKRTEFLTLLIDGDKLVRPKDRFSTIEDSVNFLRCVWDSGAVKGSVHLQVVVSKVDKLQGDANRQLIEQVNAAITRRLEHRFPGHSFHSIASRPKNGGGVPAAYGVEALLGSWIPDVSRTAVSVTTPKPINGERESEAFLHRHSMKDTL